MSKLLSLYILIFYLLCVISVSQSAELLKELKENVNFTFELLTFSNFQKHSDNSQNPNNDFLQIPSNLTELEIRLHPLLLYKRLELSVKPIMNLQIEKWEDDWSINEWLTRFNVTESLFISYGRENLQWGPSLICSPSNPFFRDNGRSNPKREVPGMDFGRIIWVPNMTWTFSFIANVDEGEQEFRTFDFRKTYAVKLDYAGQESYASIILSQKEKADNKTDFGFLGGFTASDALLLYGEGSILEGSDALYPTKNPTSPFEASMETREDPSLQYIMLGGASYTLNIGGTLTIESLYNGAGYHSEEAEEYYLLRKKAAESYILSGANKDLSMLILHQTLDPGLRFLRRNYIMLQYRHSEIKNKLDLIFRWVQNLNDDSAQLLTTADYFFGNYIQLFLLGYINLGSKNTEFKRLLDYQLMMGFEYRF